MNTVFFASFPDRPRLIIIRFGQHGKPLQLPVNIVKAALFNDSRIGWGTLIVGTILLLLI